MIALCAILLLAPEARSQNLGGPGITVKKKMFTVSGTIGLAGVSLNGFPAGPGTTPPQTDENGVFSVQVPYGWSGTVTPVKVGYEFQPKVRTVPKVTADVSGMDFTANLLTFTISGNAGGPGVKLNGFPVEVISDQTGRYTATVDYGASLVITPEKMGYRFEPPSQTYTQVTRNLQQDYKSFEVTFTISGSAGVPGIVMKGLPGNPVTGEGGRYSVEVRYGFSGKVTPEKEGCIVTPENREYAMVVEAQPNQDYSVQVLDYEISGSTGMPGVVMKGFPQDTVTDETGFYRVRVTHGWAGKITPEKPGWTFVPAFIEYKKVVTPFENQNYEGSVVYLKIEGNTGIGLVSLAGLPGNNVTSDEKGNYSTRVEYGWTGVVTPQKEGYFFEPADITYPGVTQDMTKQNFRGQRLSFEIAGNVQMPGVVLKGLPGVVTSGTDGSFTCKVDYNWSGTVIPTKAGFTFDPAERAYTNVLAPQTNQDYTARTVQYTLSGKILDKSGKPVADAILFAEGTTPVESVSTDATGAFELKLDHGWKGKITPQKDGWIFTPTMKSYEAVLAPVANQAIVGEVKMLTISNVLAWDGEPLQGVKVTAEPGPYTALSDATGRYRIKVPYGWTGSLTFFKEDLDIDANVSYANVTEDIDETGPKKPATATQPPATTTQPPTTTTKPPVTTTQPPVTTTQPPTTTTQPPVTTTQPPVTTTTPPPVTTTPPAAIPTSKEMLIQRLDQVRKELDIVLSQPLDAANQARMQMLLRQYNQLRLMIEGNLPVDPAMFTQPDTTNTVVGLPDLVRGTGTPMLLSTLTELARLSNSKIAVDMTVKDEPIAVGVGSVQGLPVNLALEQILKGTKRVYAFKVLSDGTYLVFHPISNTFPGSDLVQALQDVAAEAEVAIIPDPNVNAKAYASFENVPLEDALTKMLAGTQYVFQRMSDFYLVADRSPSAPGFPDITETRYVRLNFGTAQRTKDLLPLVYQRYVQAETASSTDPNDRGTILTVTAPKTIADKIMDIIRRSDMPRPQVMLDFRVVAMEKGNLLNLGVEWEFPTLQAGRFYNGEDWLEAIGIGYSADETFTNALLAKLNLLESTNQADVVANPQLVAQHARQAQLRSIQEEWFMMSDRVGGASDPFGFSRAELQKIESGTVLTITPWIGDNNEITLEMAVEVSDSIPRGPDSDLPIVTRRQAKNSVTIKDGGTVAVAGLTENRTRSVEKRVPVLGSIPLVGELFRNKDDQKGTKEIAVFVTASLVRENASMAGNPARSPQAIGIGSQAQPAGQEFKDGLAEALKNQSQ